ncbi:hypothetical protein [Streptomyces ortus]|uniref:Uncharacterized protein n=1 Tax=Streptomyces ortus TaxID=2867268 RepID=A0ABT3UWR0_9ACTN|nr:hypothetical protein [Streptomyces ortus]MCX4232004.1 hypothetical protein [Streptomyces ortus]
MTRYLIVHAERRGDDTVIEDPDLTVEFIDGWVLFKDRDLIQPNRVVLAIPAVQVARVERVDDEQNTEGTELAPRKE